MVRTYSVSGYGEMIADAVRMDAYAAALEATVRPGSVVVEIGTGTGMMAMLAARLGARRVYALEPSDAIHLARQAARDSGMADRIEFIQAVSTDVSLPERADVIVSDLRTILPPFQSHVRSIADARERLLAPGGVLIPRADVLRGAPVEAPDTYARTVDVWTAQGRGFDFGAVRRVAESSWSKLYLQPDQLLSFARTWATMDYTRITDPHLRGPLAWTAERAGTAHGFAMWFDAELAEGIGFTSGPDGPPTIYGCAFFPFPRPVPVRPGDEIAVEVDARLVRGEYVWGWNTRIVPAGGEAVEFRQSTFFADPLSPERLRRRHPGYRPRLREEGRADAAALARMDGGASLDEIARELRALFPDRFPSFEEALTYAGRLAETYAE
jgi:type I protein arginine methyltransferase